MKYHLLCLLAAVTLFSCSKKMDEEDEGDGDGTFITVTNNLTDPLPDLKAGYIDWDANPSTSHIFRTIGTLAPGEKSDIIPVTRLKTMQIFFFFGSDPNKWYFFDTGSNITRGMTNNLFLLGGPTSTVKPGDAYWPK